MTKSSMHILAENRNILHLKNIVAGYGEILVLKEVSLNIPTDSIVTIVGANGAGKSTLLKTVFGLIKPESGEIFYKGKDITGASSLSLLKQGISYVPQGRSNFPRMTVRENLEVGANSRSDDNINKDIDELFDRFPILRKKEKKLAGTMSGGEQQILEMAMALILNPKLLLIDEPSLGLSPIFVEMVFKTILEINKNGVSIMMVEQNARKALSVSDFGFVLELGRNKIMGTGEDILNNPEVRRMYLGDNGKVDKRR